MSQPRSLPNAVKLLPISFTKPMKAFKTLSTLAILATIALSNLSAAEWTADATAATEKSKAEDKLLLMNFTGSDWCHWCHKIEDEIFSKTEFKEYADQNLVLLTLDFPSGKVPQSDELKAQNQKLQQQYGVRGFPTLIVLNAEGEQVGQLGYTRGGPAAFIAEIDKIKAAL